MNVSIIGITGFMSSGLCKYLINNGLIVDGIYSKHFKNRSVLKKN